MPPGIEPRLICPSCGTQQAAGERFCPDCKLPLVLADQADTASDRPISARHEQARKIKPQLAEGELVRVAGSRNLAEAEFIQGLLLEEGVPSLLRRTAGFDVPDFLAAGPRDILVPASGVSTAREILLQAELITDAPSERVVAPVRLVTGVVAAFALAALIVWLALEVLR
jgi:hypothetical protein